MFLVIVALATGCNNESSQQPAPSTPRTTTAAAAPAPPPPPPPATVAPQNPTSPPPTEPNTPEPNTTETVAKVGVGAKGRYEGEGFVVTPVKSLFATRERLVFEVQIPEAVKLFKAMEDRAPNSHEEFMEKIVKANNIVLPVLPEGDQYRYDPASGELMVVSPAR